MLEFFSQQTNDIINLETLTTLNTACRELYTYFRLADFNCILQTSELI